MPKVIVNQEVFNSLHYPFYTLKKVLAENGFDLTRPYLKAEDNDFNRITFIQDELKPEEICTS